MGILNVTPDSFSDGGLFAATDAAIAHGVALRAAGADLVDVGGESTRPGAARVAPDVETARVLPVIEALSRAGVPCSVDTTRASVAAAAVAAGAVLVNDVSGGLADPAMASVVADTGAPWVLMHWRAHSATMTDHAVYGDVVAEVRDELSARVDAALAAGVAADKLLLDPGLGFAKRAEHNWALLRRLPDLHSLGLPLLVGASRKRFLPPSGHPAGSPADVRARDIATAAVTTSVAASDVWGVRVHDVEGNLQAAAVAAELRGAAPTDRHGAPA
ncbi:dihydropteroate synthase [Nakamurella deserti]|uniref:dihydropteroate synthase n=1 Tax=Nakamurella deserti TaxID=2164074 RepID=UPI000DBE34DF